MQDNAIWVELNDGNISVPLFFREALSYSQTYENIGGHSAIRTLDGTGLKQVNWSKLKTTVAGNGVFPVSLGGLDFSDSLVLKCGALRSISSPTNTITLPAERRSDAGYEPVGSILVGGRFLRTEVSVSGNIATIPVNAQAEYYVVEYFPEIEVLMNNPTESFDIFDAQSGWSFTAEQR